MTIFKTQDDAALALLRIALGLIIFPHGAQKLLGWFGGGGFAAANGFFAQLGLPTAVLVLVILAEFVGGLMLVSGLASRLVAAALIADMLGAIVFVNAANGFFGTNDGVEFPLLIIAVSTTLLLKGSGALSLDRLVQARADRKQGQRIISL